MGNETCTLISLQQVQCLPTVFRFSLSSMKFHAPRVINVYSINKIAEWIHAKTKIAQSKYLEMYKIHNGYSSPNSNFKLVQQILSIKMGPN